MPAENSSQKHVIIVGAGFAGLNTAKALANCSEVLVTLIDQHNYHLFQPLLYQVATAGLDPSAIAVPIRSQFSHNNNVRVHLGRVGQINLQEKWIKSDLLPILEARLSFDYRRRMAPTQTSQSLKRLARKLALWLLQNSFITKRLRQMPHSMLLAGN